MSRFVKTKDKGAAMSKTRLPAVLMALALLAPGLAMAQDDVPPRLPDAQLIRSTAGSPPALSRAAAEAMPVYKTAADHFAALKAKARPAASPLPDWNGVWLNAEPYQFDPGHRFGTPTTAPLKPAAMARHDKVLADLAKDIQWDVLSECLPAGHPRNLQERRPFEMIVTPKQTWILMELMNEAQRIYTDGRGHTPEDEAIPLWEGDSIGFWDGDTLIVHTNHLRDMDNGYQRSGPPQSDQTETVQQWRMVDPDHIVMQITIYDPINLTKPWVPAPRTFYRPQGFLKDLTPGYFACEKSGGVVQGADGGTHLILPGEAGFDSSGATVAK